MNKTSIRRVLVLAGFILITGAASVGAGRQEKVPVQGSADDSIKKGDDLYKSGKYREAIEAYKDALTHDPNNDHAVGYIGFSFNKLGDAASARDWMKRRVELPGQSPSAKAQILSDLAVLYWDQAHLEIAARLTAAGKLKSEDATAIGKLLAEGADSAEKAVAIAPRSAKAFNLLNLLDRDSAAIETDPARHKELLVKADRALRQSVQFFEASPQQQQSADMFVSPMVSTTNGLTSETGDSPLKVGQATKRIVPDAFKDAKAAPVTVEVFVGRDGKVRVPRIISGQGKPGEAAVAAARQWEFQPSTFEGHPVQVVEAITFPAK